MATDLTWRSSIDDLRNRAESVLRAGKDDAVSPRAAARVLAGICGHIAKRWSVEVMQRTCAELARHERAWATSFGDLPHENGSITEATQLVACVARALLPLAGTAGVRDALCFWAVENDPAVWQQVALG